MTRHRVAARRYARALLSLAEERGEVDRIAKELTDYVQSWLGNHELREVFRNPAFGARVRSDVLSAVLSRMGASATVRNTLLLLCDRQRMELVPELAEVYSELAEQKAGRARAEVITARPMSEGYYRELQQTLESVTGKRVLLIRRHDPSLIGGVVTRMGDKVLDGSVRSHLRALQQQLLSA